MIKFSIVVAVAAIALVGCQDDYKKNNPVVGAPIYVDGCEVKYIDRGDSYYSFYIAKCGDTSTTSRRYTSGKSSRNSVVITQEIDALQAEQKEAKLKEAAVGKLTEEERKVLGVEK